MFKAKLAIAGRGFRALIDRNDDRLHMRIAPNLSRRQMIADRQRAILAIQGKPLGSLVLMRVTRTLNALSKRSQRHYQAELRNIENSSVA
jgi:hypothetical protein